MRSSLCFSLILTTNTARKYKTWPKLKLYSIPSWKSGAFHSFGMFRPSTVIKKYIFKWGLFTQTYKRKKRESGFGFDHLQTNRWFECSYRQSTHTHTKKPYFVCKIRTFFFKYSNFVLHHQTIAQYASPNCTVRLKWIKSQKLFSVLSNPSQVTTN